MTKTKKNLSFYNKVIENARKNIANKKMELELLQYKRELVRNGLQQGGLIRNKDGEIKTFKNVFKDKKGLEYIVTGYGHEPTEIILSQVDKCEIIQNGIIFNKENFE